MRNALAVWAALIASLTTAAVASADFYTPPVVSVPKVKAPPVVDGILAPGEWSGAAALSPFVLLGGKGMPQAATEVWVMYDDHNLYVGALMHDANPAGLKADSTERDGPVWLDDALELIFDTEDQRKSYIHLATNPKETQYDAMGQDKSADYRWTVRAATLTNGWSVELELPFANDFPPAPGVSWGFAAGRHANGSNETSSWARFDGSFHEVSRIGSMIFGTPPMLPDVTALGSLWLGDNTAQVSLRNPGDRAVSGKVNVRVIGRQKRGDSFGATKVSLAAGARATQNVPYRVGDDGFSTVTLAVTDAAGKTIWRSAPYPVVTPEVSPAIYAVEASLAETMRRWMQLPDGTGKAALRDELDGLAVQWRYLVRQYAGRAKLEPAALEALAAYAGRLRGDADMLSQKVSAGQQTGRTDAEFTITATSDMTNVFPELLSLAPGQPVRLDACRNATESAQVVVLPFR